MKVSLTTDYEQFREDFEFLFWYRGLMGNFNDPGVEIFSIYFN